MRKITLLIISFTMVFAGCVGPKAIVTESCIPGDTICREYDLETGKVTRTTFGPEREEGTRADFFEICNGNPESSGTECRQIISTTGIFGSFQPWYDCGGWGCSFWP